MAKQQGITYDEITADLKAKNYKSIYFLMGEEPYYIDLISDYIQDNILDESQKGFDLTVVYGKKETKMADVINLAKRFPVMSPKQIIIVKEAQNIRKDEWEKFAFYIKQPQEATILVLCYKYGKPDGRMKWFTETKKSGVVFESDKLYENQMGAWIKQYARQKGITIDAKAESMLVEFLGNDLSKMANEINKLLLTKPANTNTITPDLVEKNIGISKDYNVFELKDALIAGNVLKANRIIRYFGENKKENPLVVVLSQLFSIFTNLMIYHYLGDKSQANVAS
ncbi:MAG: DNA polymerase III subunit delta, partial [Paludibacter sp.]|nr:DNA polymerase III subunit delta [Paludibacter sp.]